MYHVKENPAGEGGAVIQLWRADKTEYSTLEAIDQRLFDRFRERVSQSDAAPSLEKIAHVIHARQCWLGVYNHVLSSNFGGKYD